MKEIDLSENESSAYGGTFGYHNWCTNDAPDVNQTNRIRMSRIPLEPDNRDLPYGCSGNNQVYHNNPINDWVKMQWEGDYDTIYDAPTIVLTTYPDGARTFQSHYGGALTTSNWLLTSNGNPKQNNLRMVSIGGFARIPRFNNGINSFRYFTAIYMDNTHARVMIGDEQSYNSCTIMEPQPPATWSNESISFELNQGSLSDNTTAYLFVFNAQNEHNTIGYPIEIGTSSTTSLPAPSNFTLTDEE